MAVVNLNSVGGSVSSVTLNVATKGKGEFGAGVLGQRPPTYTRPVNRMVVDEAGATLNG
jgi:hypothetical protein